MSFKDTPFSFAHQIKDDRLLVHNAGVGIRSSIADTSLDQWQQTLESNFTAIFLLTQALLPLIPSGGSIVIIGSGVVARPLPGMALYGASKAGITYFTQVLAQELGPQGIRANIISPGSIDTEFGGQAKSDAFKQQIASRTALGRIGQPDDIASVALFLSSDLARFVTGQNIFVDGGIS